MALLARRPICFLALLLGAFLPCCATAPPPAAGITSLVHDWFALLEAPEAGSADFERFLAAPAFELTGDEGRILGIEDLRARHRELHSTYVRIVHRIRKLRIEPSSGDLYAAHFEVERSAVDFEGTPHLQRKKVTWSVRAGPDVAILQIDERPLLPYPGSGPRIVCY